jgi:hypothetical protein
VTNGYQPMVSKNVPQDYTSFSYPCSIMYWFRVMMSNSPFEGSTKMNQTDNSSHSIQQSESLRLRQINTSQATILFMIILTIARVFWQHRLYNQGFVSVSADEFARGLRALDWSQHLKIRLFSDLLSPWPPFEMYLNGLAVWLGGDPFLAPRVTVFAASCLLLVALFLLVHRLWDIWVVAALTVLFVAAQPWFIWLSGTPMLEVYYLACFFGGLYFLATWLRERAGMSWLYAGLLFFLASGFHIQSWAQVNLINLLTLPLFFQFVVQRQYKSAGQLALLWLIGNSLVLFWGASEYAATGRLFAILANHTEYSLWFYGGYNVPISEKLLYFPRIVSRVIPLWLWVAAGVGLMYIVAEKRNYDRLLSSILGLLTLTLASLFNLTAGPPSAAPDRYAIFYLLLLAPYAAYAVYQSSLWGWRKAKWAGRDEIAYGGAVVACSALAMLLISAASQAQRFPVGMSIDTIETGRYLRTALDGSTLGTSPLQTEEFILLEARYWDFLALRLTIEQDEWLLYDREHDYLNRNNPSRLLDEDKSVKDWLVEARVGLVALRDPDLKERADQLSFLTRQKEVGDWVIYRLATVP